MEKSSYLFWAYFLCASFVSIYSTVAVVIYLFFFATNIISTDFFSESHVKVSNIAEKKTEGSKAE